MAHSFPTSNREKSAESHKRTAATQNIVPKALPYDETQMTEVVESIRVALRRNPNRGLEAEISQILDFVSFRSPPFDSELASMTPY